jgi:hypothetical protein
MDSPRWPCIAEPQIKNFHKLTRGELPRLDALHRICKGLGMTEEELIVGMSKSKPTEPAEVVEIKKVLQT